jgi:hypothetical protein
MTKTEKKNPKPIKNSSFNDICFPFPAQLANGLRYRRGGRARLAYIMARNLANRAASLGAKAPSGARFVCDLFARNHPQGWGMSGESRLIFVTAYPCRTMILRKRYPINPCLPGERETAPSLGVRLVNAGRKREAASETVKPDDGSAWAGDYGQDN